MLNNPPLWFTSPEQTDKLHKKNREKKKKSERTRWVKKVCGSKEQMCPIGDYSVAVFNRRRRLKSVTIDLIFGPTGDLGR